MIGTVRKMDRYSTILNGVRNGDATPVAIMLVPSGIAANSGCARMPYR